MFHPSALVASPAPGLGQTSYQVGASGEKRASRPYDGVSYTIDDMRELVRSALTKEQNPALRELTESIIAQVTPKDYLSEIAAIYYYVLKNVRYVRDPLHVELVQHPYYTLTPKPWDRAAGRRGRTGDCDDQATSLAAMVMSIGNRAEFVTISTDRSAGFHHVFCVVHTPDNLRLVLDPVPGPNATEMINATVKYQAWPIEPVRIPGRMNNWQPLARPMQGR